MVKRKRVGGLLGEELRISRSARSPKRTSALGERMQIGFESGATEEVIYGRNEPSLVHLPQLYPQRPSVLRPVTALRTAARLSVAAAAPS